MDVFCFHYHSPNAIIIQTSLKSSKYTTLSSPGGEIHPLSCIICLLSLIRMNAAVWHLDQIISIFASLSGHQVMTWASHVIGCGFIFKWNLVSLLVEFLFLSRVFQQVPQLAIKPQQQYRRAFPRKKQEAINIQSNANSETALGFFFLPICQCYMSSFQS